MMGAEDPPMPFDVARYQALRRSSALGREVVHVESTTSTMDLARQGIAEGRPCGTAYVAAEQTAGRGRLGRSWVSAAGAGLWVTLHLCPEGAAEVPLITAAASLAVADAVEASAGLRVDLKWPNDVLVEGRKLCGTLAEAQHGRGRLDVLLGIGLNTRAAAEMPPEVAAIATSLEAEGARVPSREELLAALVGALERRLEALHADPAAAVAAWRERLVTLGQRVRAVTPGGEFEGVATDVTASGELIIEEGGERRVVSAADILPAS
jgi:BirA family biotin operon repressor/biotin-[acetyl-CoA-carboxylase] ligase